MKIAMLTYFEEEGGGVVTHAENLIKRIAKYPDFELHIITIGSDISRIANQHGATIHFIKEANILAAQYFYYPMLLRKKILEINPDIIHVQGVSTSYSIALALTKKYPIIVTMHGNIVEELTYRGLSSLNLRIKTKIDSYLERQLLKRASSIIIPYPLLKKHLRELSNCFDSMIHYIPNGLDMEAIQIAGHYKYFEHPCILYVGRLERIKSVDILLKAIPSIKCSIPNINLYIIGSGSEEKRLKNLVKELNIEEKAKFWRFITTNKIFSCYNSADIFVNPSKDGIFSLTTLEALACGTPVVTSNISGIPWIIEDGKTGFLFEHGNVKKLAEKVITLLQDKELQETVGRAGYKKAKEFSWDKIAKETVALYRKILSEVK